MGWIWGKLEPVIVLMVFVLCSSTISIAHLNYPSVCCGNHDCGVIEKIVYTNSGDRIITIKIKDGTLATAVFPKNFTVSLPIDDKEHACIVDSMPRCLFLNGGV